MNLKEELELNIAKQEYVKKLLDQVTREWLDSLKEIDSLQKEHNSYINCDNKLKNVKRNISILSTSAIALSLITGISAFTLNFPVALICGTILAVDASMIESKCIASKKLQDENASKIKRKLELEEILVEKKVISNKIKKHKDELFEEKKSLNRERLNITSDLVSSVIGVKLNNKAFDFSNGIYNKALVPESKKELDNYKKKIIQ